MRRDENTHGLKSYYCTPNKNLHVKFNFLCSYISETQGKECVLLKSSAELYEERDSDLVISISFC